VKQRRRWIGHRVRRTTNCQRAPSLAVAQNSIHQARALPEVLGYPHMPAILCYRRVMAIRQGQLVQQGVESLSHEPELRLSNWRAAGCDV
jgi:hypothetical protein